MTDPDVKKPLPLIRVLKDVYYQPIECVGEGSYARVYRAYEVYVPHATDPRRGAGMGPPVDSYVARKVIIKLSLLVAQQDDDDSPGIRSTFYQFSPQLVGSPFGLRLATFVNEVLIGDHVGARFRASAGKKRTRQSLGCNATRVPFVEPLSYGFTVYAPLGGVEPLGYLVYADTDAVSLDEWARTTSTSRAVHGRNVVRQVALSLKKMHAHGVVHADLSVCNVVVSTESSGVYRATPIDLGLSTVLDDATLDSIRERSTVRVRPALVNLCNTAIDLHVKIENFGQFTYLRHALIAYDTKTIVEPVPVYDHPVSDPRFDFSAVSDTMTPGQFAQRADAYALAVIWMQLVAGERASGPKCVDRMRAHADFRGDELRLIDDMLDRVGVISMKEVLARM